MNLVPVLGVVSCFSSRSLLLCLSELYAHHSSSSIFTSLLHRSNAQVQQWDNPTSSHSQWIIRNTNSIATGVVTLQNMASGKFLNVSGGKRDNGRNVHIWDNPTSPSSQWCVLQVIPGTYVLENLASGKVLNISGGKAPNGTNAQQWDNPTSPHSHWRIH